MPWPGFRKLLPVLSASVLVLACSSPAARPRPDPEDAAAAAIAERLVAGMSDAEAAAQLLLTGVDGSASLGRRSAELLSRVPVGGTMLFKYNLGKGPAAAARLAGDIRSATAGPVPPFVAADRGFIDAVITPRSTRRRLARALAMLRTKKLEQPPRKHDNMPL